MKLHLTQTGPLPVDERVNIDHFPFIMGRSSSCDYQVFHPMVSRKHCELIWSNAGVLIEDLHSSNGTYVNGHRVKNKEELHDGDEINLGCISYRVTVAPSTK
jgi:pSer/pThr/pTyr-binding forkhead associated (FHA) protein